MTKQARGSSLAGAVCVISIALVAALTIATSASLNAGMLQQTENAQVASLLADSAIQQGLAELMKTPSWGTNPAADRINYAGPVDKSSVLLTFDKTAGVPYSTNNQTGSSPQGWAASRVLSNRTVPGERVHLVAVGHCRNVTRTREAVVYVPNFTISLGCTGKVHLTNSLVGSLKSVSDLANVDANPALLGPGDLATNSDLSDSVILEVSSKVTGNLQSRGDVSLRTGSTVQGEVRRGYSNTELPHFKFDDYDPARSPNPGDPPALNYQALAPGVLGDQNLVGIVRCDGSATITGDLHLDNCLLFVTGDLSVKGGVRGSGAVIVKGSTRVEGGTTLTSDDSIALLSRGNIDLIGNQPNTYQFQGLVYTNGNFTARNFTVVGGFIADGTVPGTGNVDLHGSRAFNTAMATHVDIYVPFQQTLQIASSVNEPKDADLAITGDGSKISYGQSPVSVQSTPAPSVPADQYDTPYEGAVFNNGGGGWDWWNPVFLQISREKVNGQEQYVYTIIYNDNGLQSFRYESQSAVIDALVNLAATKCPAYMDAKNNNGPTPVIDATSRDVNGNPYPPECYGLREETPEYFKAKYRLIMPVWAAKNHIPGGSGQANFSFDPNRFLKENEKIRISATTEY